MPRRSLEELTPEQLAARVAEKAEKERVRAQLARSIQYDIADKFVNKPDTARRKRAEKSLPSWLKTYLSERFSLPWAKYHYDLCDDIEQALKYQCSQATAAPRGGGKSAFIEGGMLYGALTGKFGYGVVLTATGKLAPKSMASFATAIRGNELLLQDYEHLARPYVIVGSGTAQKCRTMLYNGEPVWEAGADKPFSPTRLVLPSTAEEAGSGAILESCGLLEASRGIKYARADKIIRPDVVLVDDPQTPKSAKSQGQCEERRSAILSGAAKLGGPARDVSLLIALTVIEPGDLADELLDRAKHPALHGVRTAMLTKWPVGCNPRVQGDRTSSADAAETAKLWDTYAEIYRAELSAGSAKLPDTSKFYAQNKAAMNRGAEPSWPDRHPGAATAVEYAMRLWIKDPSSFLAEMQNDPGIPQADDDVVMLTADQAAAKTNSLPRYEVQLNATRGTFFIDCHDKLLYYGVTFWSPGMTGALVDYGSWPEQPGRHYELHHCRKPIHKNPLITATTEQGQLYQALHALTAMITAREYRTAAGEEVELALGLVDAGWMTDAVYDFCAEAKRKYGVMVRPSHGQSFGPTKCPISQWKVKNTKGQIGDEWHFPPRARNRAIRHVLFDANRRKTALFRGLSIPLGDSGCFSLYAGAAGEHKLLSQHITAVVAKHNPSPWGNLTMYKKPPRREDHLLDCLSGCATAESMLGGKLLRLGKSQSLVEPQQDTAAQEDAEHQDTEVTKQPQPDAAPRVKAPAKAKTKRRAVTYMEH